MMRNTPRTFVGPVVIQLQGPVRPGEVDAVRRAVSTLEDVSLCSLDTEAGVLVVSARAPVDRAEVVALLHRVGCRVQG